MVAWRSTFGFDAFTQTFTAPAPSTVVFDFNGGVTYDAALPAGGTTHLYGGGAVQSPPSPPAGSPGKALGGRPWACHFNEAAPACAGLLPGRAALPPEY